MNLWTVSCPISPVRNVQHRREASSHTTFCEINRQIKLWVKFSFSVERVASKFAI